MSDQDSDNDDTNGGPAVHNFGKPFPDARYAQSKVLLYGIAVKCPLPSTSANSKISIEIKVVKEESIITGEELARPVHEIALIYGFSHQGHCYSLAEPKLFLVKKPDYPQRATGCGYDGFYTYTHPKKGDEEDVYYYMWEADKLEETVQLEIRQGFIEELVLDQNLPEEKRPSSYRIATQLGHRGGKLTR
jgi:hypothetical protein